jgi:hypothetical protein
MTRFRWLFVFLCLSYFPMSDEALSEKQTFEVKLDERLGKSSEFNARTKTLFEFVGATLEVKPTNLEIKCLAYCTKASLDSAPDTEQEYLFLVEHQGTSKKSLLLAVKTEEGWKLLPSPTHNVAFSSQMSVDVVSEATLEEFVKKTTFGFYDFLITDVETLYVSSHHESQLSFLLKPLPQAQRRGRMGLFVAPGP